jgi:ankyrin repeat protein
MANTSNTSDAAARDELLAAVKVGDAATVRALIERDPALADARDADGVSLLLTALYRGHAGVVEVLREVGAPPDVHDAAALGEASLLRDLLDGDASLAGAYSADGWTPLHLAAHFGRTDAANVLLAAGADVAARSRNPMANQPLHAAVAGDAPLELVRALLARGADVNATQRGGFTPLHGAAQNGNLALVRLLLEAGADPAARSQGGKTARDFAAEAGHDGVVQALDQLVGEDQSWEEV